MNRKKKVIKSRAEISEIESKKAIKRINETKSWFFGMINKINKTLVGFTKKGRERSQINTI